MTFIVNVLWNARKHEVLLQDPPSCLHPVRSCYKIPLPAYTQWGPVTRSPFLLTPSEVLLQDPPSCLHPVRSCYKIPLPAYTQWGPVTRSPFLLTPSEVLLQDPPSCLHPVRSCYKIPLPAYTQWGPVTRSPFLLTPSEVLLQDPPSCYKIPLPVTRSPFLLQDPPSCYKIPLPVTRSPFLLTPSACYRVVTVHLSVDLVWPSTTIRGRLFHFKQAIIRHAYSMGLKADYDTIGNPIRSAIQMLGAHAWVPEGKIVEAYHIIKPTLSSNLAEFIQYFEEIWISTPISPARYRPSQWNQYIKLSSLSGIGHFNPRHVNILHTKHTVIFMITI